MKYYSPPPPISTTTDTKQQTPKHLFKRKSYMKYTIKFNLFKFKRLSFDFFLTKSLITSIREKSMFDKSLNYAEQCIVSMIHAYLTYAYVSHGKTSFKSETEE